jgi:hypothetical protein
MYILLVICGPVWLPLLYNCLSSFCLYVCLSSVCLPFCLSVCFVMSVCLSVCLSTWLSVILSVCLSMYVCLFVCLSVCLFVSLSFCLSAITIFYNSAALNPKLGTDLMQLQGRQMTDTFTEQLLTTMCPIFPSCG